MAFFNLEANNASSVFLNKEDDAPQRLPDIRIIRKFVIMLIKKIMSVVSLFNKRYKSRPKSHCLHHIKCILWLFYLEGKLYKCDNILQNHDMAFTMTSGNPCSTVRTNRFILYFCIVNSRLYIAKNPDPNQTVSPSIRYSYDFFYP